jgi:transposase
MNINIPKQTTSNDLKADTLPQNFDFSEIEFPKPEKPKMKGNKSKARTLAKGEIEISETEKIKALEDMIPKTTVALDLGDTKHAVCIINQVGQIEKEYKIENHAAAIWILSQEYPEARFVMEVGTHSPWISAQFKAEGCEVIVANARKLRAIYANERKCDELDARMLSRIGRLDKTLLYPICHVSQDALKDRLVISTRENLVNERKRLVQSVKGSVKSLGLRVKGGSEAFPQLCREQLAPEPEVLETLEPTLKVIETMNESIATLDFKLEFLCCEKYPITKRFMQIKGVGPITAIAFALAIEDADRIDITRDVGAYLGLVPRRDQSGDSDKQLGISKTGNVYLRKLLVQCAQYIMGAYGEDCDLKRYGQRIAKAKTDGAKGKGAKGAKKKAVVAVARKLAVLLMTLWKTGADYDPLYNSRQTEGEAKPVTG